MSDQFCIAYSGDSFTLEFEMWSSGQLQSGLTVGNIGLKWKVSGGSYVDLATLTNSITPVGEGTYALVLTSAELGTEGVGKAMISESGCDDTAVTVQVVTEIPAKTVTLLDKEGIWVASGSWDEQDERVYDGHKLWQIRVGHVDWWWAPNDGPNSETPGIKSMGGGLTRWYFINVDANGGRDADAVEDWSDEDTVWPGGS